MQIFIYFWYWGKNHHWQPYLLLFFSFKVNTTEYPPIYIFKNNSTISYCISNSEIKISFCLTCKRFDFHLTSDLCLLWPSATSLWAGNVKRLAGVSRLKTAVSGSWNQNNELKVSQPSVKVKTLVLMFVWQSIRATFMPLSLLLL